MLLLLLLSEGLHRRFLSSLEFVVLVTVVYRSIVITLTCVVLPLIPISTVLVARSRLLSKLRRSPEVVSSFLAKRTSLGRQTWQGSSLFETILCLVRVHLNSMILVMNWLGRCVIVRLVPLVSRLERLTSEVSI